MVIRFQAVHCLTNRTKTTQMLLVEYFTKLFDIFNCLSFALQLEVINLIKIVNIKNIMLMITPQLEVLHTLLVTSYY